MKYGLTVFATCVMLAPAALAQSASSAKVERNAAAATETPEILATICGDDAATIELTGHEDVAVTVALDAVIDCANPRGALIEHATGEEGGSRTQVR